MPNKAIFEAVFPIFLPYFCNKVYVLLTKQRVTQGRYICADPVNSRFKNTYRIGHSCLLEGLKGERSLAFTRTFGSFLVFSV